MPHRRNAASRQALGMAAALTIALGLAGAAMAEDAPATAPAAASAPAAPDDGKSRGNLRDTRYCEIVPIFRSGLTFNLEVYNTLGSNDCPPEIWDKLDADTLARELDAFEVILNGPRYWVMDTIIGQGATMEGKRKSFDGLEATQRATVHMPVFDLLFGKRYYKVRVIDRETVYIYDAGKPVYEITDDEGNVYVMQTYADIVDPTLKMADLAGLGARLKLPKGWSFSTRVLNEEMRLTASGKAYLIQDDLDNSYQRRN